MGIIFSPYKGCHIGDTLKIKRTPIPKIKQQQLLINQRQSQGAHSFITIKMSRDSSDIMVQLSYLILFKVNNIPYDLFLPEIKNVISRAGI